MNSPDNKPSQVDILDVPFEKVFSIILKWKQTGWSSFYRWLLEKDQIEKFLQYLEQKLSKDGIEDTKALRQAYIFYDFLRSEYGKANKSDLSSKTSVKVRNILLHSNAWPVFSGIQTFEHARQWLCEEWASFSWDERSLEIFLNFMSTFYIPEDNTWEKRKMLFTMFFHFPSIKWCQWNSNHLHLFAKSIKRMPKWQMKSLTKKIFFSLPDIKRRSFVERRESVWSETLKEEVPPSWNSDRYAQSSDIRSRAGVVRSRA